jgi:DNA-binding LacI/PurR family transcriptional regulator
MHAVPPRPSLITHSADFLREALLRGDWAGNLPSERTLCLRLRISRPTLRAVLAQLEREGLISAVENKKRRILAVPAAMPASRPTSIVLLTPVAAQLMPPFVLFWLDALRVLLSEAGYSLEVHASAPCFSAKPAAALEKLARRTPAAAWVLFRSTAVMQRWFVEHRLPAVIAGSCAEGVGLPSVDIDYRAACRHAAVMLRQKGHRRIALLLPDSSHGGDAESEHGFREAFAGVADVTPLVLRHEETVVRLVACLEEVLRGKPRPGAFLVARSSHALTVITHLLRAGYRLPRDFAVVSRDDDAFLDHVVPQVTRYAADPARFAKRLAKLVLELAQSGRTTLAPVRLMPDLRRGETG